MTGTPATRVVRSPSEVRRGDLGADDFAWSGPRGAGVDLVGRRRRPRRHCPADALPENADRPHCRFRHRPRRSVDTATSLCNRGSMAKQKKNTTKKKPRKDESQIALAVVEKAIGGKLAKKKPTT